MTSRDIRGLIQVPDQNFFDSKRTEKKDCTKCHERKNIPEINNGLCDACIKKLLK